MPLLALIVLWVVLSLVAAPMIGALFAPRRRSDLHEHAKEPTGRRKEPLGRRGEEQEE